MVFKKQNRFDCVRFSSKKLNIHVIKDSILRQLCHVATSEVEMAEALKKKLNNSEKKFRFVKKRKEILIERRTMMNNEIIVQQSTTFLIHFLVRSSYASLSCIVCALLTIFRCFHFELA